MEKDPKRVNLHLKHTFYVVHMYHGKYGYGEETFEYDNEEDAKAHINQYGHWYSHGSEVKTVERRAVWGFLVGDNPPGPLYASIIECKIAMKHSMIDNPHHSHRMFARGVK